MPSLADILRFGRGAAGTGRAEPGGGGSRKHGALGMRSDAGCPPAQTSGPGDQSVSGRASSGSMIGIPSRIG